MSGKMQYRYKRVPQRESTADEEVEATSECQPWRTTVVIIGHCVCRRSVGAEEAKGGDGGAGVYEDPGETRSHSHDMRSFGLGFCPDAAAKRPGCVVR